MKKRFRNGMAVVLSLIMVISVLTSATVIDASATGFTPRTTAPDSSNAYYYSANPFYQAGYGMPNCTAYAFGRAYELLGSRPSLSTGNAGKWWWYNKNNGIYAYGSTPKLGAIVCWDQYDQNQGHVAVVEAINGSQITISESHYGGTFFTTRTINADSSNYLTSYRFLGYIYIGDFSAEDTPVDLGTEFYAAIVKSNSWIHLANVNGNVQLVNQNELLDPSDVWYFVKQDDGSYVIYNCLDGNVLDVSGAGTTDGVNVGTYPYWGHDAQKWFVYGRWSGEYILKSKLCDKVLDVTDNSDAIGTNVQLWTYNNSSSQQLAIYKLDKVGSSKLSVTPGTSNTETKFTWTKASNATSYNLRITCGTPGNMKTYMDVWGTNETSYSIVLPAGYYEVYVDAANKFSYLASNTESFYVAESVIGSSKLSVTPGTSNTETQFTWTEASNATSYNLRITCGTPGNMKTYMDVWGTNETSYSIVLPAGYYEVYVDAANKFSYLASNTVSFYVAESVQGDTNSDGKVNLLDAISAQSAALDLLTLDEQGTANADMNGDGKITMFDAIAIQRLVLSL
ncbi:MAG: RICIN domain-containing protein [Acutalibacteraceae bacterium]